MLVFVLCLRPNPILVVVSAAGASTFALGALKSFCFQPQGWGGCQGPLDVAYEMATLFLPPYCGHLIVTTLLCTLPCDPSDAAMFPLMPPCIACCDDPSDAAMFPLMPPCVARHDDPSDAAMRALARWLLQFPSEEEVSIELDITPEALAAKNEKVCMPSACVCASSSVYYVTPEHATQKASAPCRMGTGMHSVHGHPSALTTDNTAGHTNKRAHDLMLLRP